MIFLGNCFCLSNHAGDTAVVDVNIDNIQLSNGVYDNLYISKKVLPQESSSIAWDYDTVLYALFKDDLLAGNIGAALDSITSIRIKQREKGMFDWKTIDEIPIHTADDLKIIREYKYCKSNTTYEFALVPVLNGNIEGNINLTEVYSKFSGVYLIEKDVMIHAFLNLQLSQQRNRINSVVNTLGRTKPFYIANSNNNYDSGSLSTTFIQYNRENCSFDIENGSKYRKEIDKFLSDDKIKILKTDDGNMWMIGIVDTITQDTSQHPQMPIHSISWTEVGDCESVRDMYLNGLTDVCVEAEL